MVRTLSLLFVCLFVINCSNSSPEKAASTTRIPDKAKDHLTARQLISFYDRPQGTQMAQLEAGTIISLTPTISDQLYTHFTDRDTLCLPYLQILLSQHKSGWILAEANQFEGLSPEWEFRQCMRAVLSEQDFNNYEHLIDTWNNTQQAPLLLLAFETEHQLIRQLEEVLRPYPYLSTATFENLLPATITYNNNETLSWWVDYNQWVERSLQTNEIYDDALMMFYQKKIFPPDGISYGFPAWTFPVSTNEDYSLLGRGIYFAYLEELVKLRQKHNQITYKWNELIELIISDLLEPNRSFWEELAPIEEELDAIINLEVPIIQHHYRKDLEDLQVRLRNSATERTGFRGK